VSRTVKSAATAVALDSMRHMYICRCHELRVQTSHSLTSRVTHSQVTCNRSCVTLDESQVYMHASRTPRTNESHIHMHVSRTPCTNESHINMHASRTPRTNEALANESCHAQSSRLQQSVCVLCDRQDGFRAPTLRTRGLGPGLFLIRQKEEIRKTKNTR